MPKGGQVSSSKKLLKQKLQKQFGSLRKVSAFLGISRWRLSSFLNGWIDLTPDENKKLFKSIRYSDSGLGDK